jgi:heparanase 1
MNLLLMLLLTLLLQSISALLWHRLMGRNVLSTTFSGTNKICAYAHCAIASVSRSIKLGLANKISYIMPSVLVITARNYIAVDQPRRKHTVKVHVSTESVASNGTLAIQQQEARRAKFSRMSRCSLFRYLLSIRGVCCRLDH